MEWILSTIALFGNFVLIACDADYMIDLETSSPLYINQAVSIKCLVRQPTDLVAVEFKLTESSGKALVDARCKNEAGFWTSAITSHSGMNIYCHLVMDAGISKLQVEALGQMSPNLLKSVARCNFTMRSSRNDVYKTLEFPPIAVAPTSISFASFKFEDGVPVLNRTMLIKCFADSASPPCSFSYILYNRSRAQIYKSDSRFNEASIRIAEDAMHGFVVKCICTNHFEGVLSSTRRSCDRVKDDDEYCYPYYVMSKVPLQQTVILNPDVENELFCDVQGYPESLIRFSWSIDGIPNRHISQRYVMGRASSRTKMVECKATVYKHEVIINWRISWDQSVSKVQSSTTVSPTRTTELPFKKMEEMPIPVRLATGLMVVQLVLAFAVIAVVQWKFDKHSIIHEIRKCIQSRNAARQ